MKDERAMVDMVSGDGFLGSYVAYGRSVTASPRVFHLSTGLSIMAAAAGNQVSFYGAGDVRYSPNLYNLILGPSGVHKTTAINIGAGLLRRAKPQTLMPDQSSVEAFINVLKQHPSRLYVAEEFATLLSDMERSYLVGMKETFTKLFDPREEFVRSLKGEGEVRIKRPALTILAASTADWLLSHLKEVDFVSGFMPRFFLWPSEIKEPEPKGGAMATGDAHERDSLVRQLHAIGELQDARVVFSPDAIRTIARFDSELKQDRDLSGTRRELDGLISRCGNYCAKVATLLALSDDGCQATYEIGPDQAKRATRLVQWLVEQANALFEEQLVFEKFEREAQALLRIIPPDGLLWSVGLKKSRKSAADFGRLVGTLVERGQVHIGSKAVSRQASKALYRLYPEEEKPGTTGELPGTTRESDGNYSTGDGAVIQLRRVQNGDFGGD